MEKLDYAVQNVVRNVYQSKERYYHNLDHINFMLKSLQDLIEKQPEVISKIVYYDEFKLAIWFHDLVISGDHPIQDSIEIMYRFLGQNPINRYIESLIEATDHDGKELITFQEKLIHDLDLFIFAQDRNVYGRYACNVKNEFSVICSDSKDFETKRIEVLEKFLQGDIFLTDYFKDSEYKARENLNWELMLLRLKNKDIGGYLYNTYIFESFPNNRIFLCSEDNKERVYKTVMDLMADKGNLKEDILLLILQFLKSVGYVSLVPETEYQNLLLKAQDNLRFTIFKLN